MIKEFGVDFGDNDFHSTFETWLPVVAKCVNDMQSLDIYPSKQDLVRFINEGLYAAYAVGQQPMHGINAEGLLKYEEHYRKYLIISEEKVYIDNELREEIQTGYQKGWHNGELFCCTVEDKPYFWSL